MENTKNPEPKNSETAAQSAGKALQQDLLEQLMKPEVQSSLQTLVEQLPKITEMTTTLTKTYDLLQTVANDRILLDDMKGGFMQVLNPVKDKVKHYASAAIEAGDRAKSDTRTIGLFDLVKMLKDPQVQKMFRFLQAYMNVLSEREQQR